MRNPYTQFQPIGKTWLIELNNYNEVPFKRKTTEIKWSLGELYGHLHASTLDFHLKGVERCLLSPVEGGKTWTGRSVFFRGSFNNSKLKHYMQKEYGSIEAEEIATAKDKMIRVLKQMDEWGSKITTENMHQKAEHPVLGCLSVVEWYRLVVLHFQYHQKNKTKINRFITS